MTAPLAIRPVALRDGLTLHLGGSKTAMVDGLVMFGDHSTVNRRHWRALASAFCITDYSNTPLVWIEGDYVVGEMAATTAKSRAALMAAGFTPFPMETLMRVEVIGDGGGQFIRSWWAQGDNIHRTSLIARHEPVVMASFGERMVQLARLMNRRD